MARAHYVKKARKANPVAKVGEDYWWWKPMIGGRGAARRYSKTRPRPSQVTSSEFLSNVYALQEEMTDAKAESQDDLEGLMDEWTGRIDEIQSETQDKLDNMPEGLQQGDTGQLLQERIDAMEQWRSDLENIDLECEVDKDADKTLADMVQKKLQELQECDPGL